MSTRTTSQILPYSREQLFDLAADIESYPDYLPGWISVRIIKQSENRLVVEQQLGLPLLHTSFTSTAELERPGRVYVYSDDGPFQMLHIEWRFDTAKTEQCRVSFKLDFKFNNHTLEKLTSTFFDMAASDIMARFQARARELYGPGS